MATGSSAEHVRTGASGPGLLRSLDGEWPHRSLLRRIAEDPGVAARRQVDLHVRRTTGGHVPNSPEKRDRRRHDRIWLHPLCQILRARLLIQPCEVEMLAAVPVDSPLLFFRKADGNVGGARRDDGIRLDLQLREGHREVGRRGRGTRGVSCHNQRANHPAQGMSPTVRRFRVALHDVVQRQPSFYGLNTRSQNSQITARHFERSREISLK